MSSILVVGSQGTLGRPFVRDLLKGGFKVSTSDIGHSNEPNHVRCDISQYRQVERLFNRGDFDLVYNLAAEFGRLNGEEFYEQLWTTNVVGLKNLLKLQEKKKFRLVHFSSSEIYGEYKTHDGFFSESLSEEIPLKQTNDYALSKWVNELQIRNSMTKKNTETMILRLTNAYGPGEYYTPYRSVVTIFIYRVLHNLPYDVYLGYHRAFMYIDDLTHTLCNTVCNFKSGEVYNIGGEEYVAMKTVSDMILNYVGEDDSLVRYLPQDIHSIVSKRPDISKAKRDLEHKLTVPLSVGIPKTVEWHREVYKV